MSSSTWMLVRVVRMLRSNAINQSNLNSPDLTSLFNWNTKQVFVYITASYPSSSPSTIPPSELVIWDAIIPADNLADAAEKVVHAVKNGAAAGAAKGA